MSGIRISYRSIVRINSIHRYSSSSSKKLLEFLATMPKPNSERIASAQRQRQNISKKSEKYGPSNVYLQVLGSGARGAPNTLYLFTDQKRYLFNCGECTQRLAHEYKVKLSKLDHIFITSKTWRNIGGLPGLSLTLQDVGVPNITLHGPSGLDELYNATRRFIVMKDMNVTMANCSPTEDFDDNALTVKYVLLSPDDDIFLKDLKDVKPAAKKPKLENTVNKEFEEFINDDTDYYKTNLRRNDEPRNKEKAKPPKQEKDEIKKKSEKLQQHLARNKTQCTVAYICTLKKRLGTLDLAKCVELGVKPGPLLGQLKNGQDVILPDGRVVLSSEVKTPDDPGPVFIVLEVPDLSYLKELEFSQHFDNGVNPPTNIPALVVHFTPPHVLNNPIYRDFMAKFGPTTQHLVLNSQNSCLGSEAVHRSQHKLHLLDSDIFPLLKDASLPSVWNSNPRAESPKKEFDELKNKIALAQFQSILNMEGSRGDGHVTTDEGDANKLELIAGRTLTSFQLRPKKQLDRSSEPKLHIQDYIQEAMDMNGFAASLEQFRHLVDSVRYKNPSLQEYPKVVFLGTGSCIPSKTRNTSGIALQIDENRSMLLDCGEGTFGQLVRFYGPKKVNGFLRTLKAIYVSHLHADHHIGLIGILQARREALELMGHVVDPVYLLAPGQIYSWLSVYDQLFERVKNEFTLIPNQNLLENATSASSEMTSAVLADIGVQQIRTCLVAHCPNAFGVAIQLDEHKITYSGDTIPCDALVNIGQNSTLLIHEATMEDELADEARIKMHSTTSQAIDIGEQMNAKYTLLTHFSQRYARLPRLNQHILHDNKRVGIAFDNMQITINDLELLPHMYAPLQLMFAEHCIEMEMKAANRALKERKRMASPTMPAKEINVQKVAKRGVSPDCHISVRPTLPSATSLKYRDSNASRLRRMHRMTHGRDDVSVKSKSPSPCSRQQSVTPSVESQLIDGIPPSSRESENTLLIQNDSVEFGLSPTRTISEVSFRSADKDGKIEVCNVAQDAACGFTTVIDSRSKTLNQIDDALKSKVSKLSQKVNLSNASVSSSSSGRPGTPATAKSIQNENSRVSAQSLKRKTPQIEISQTKSPTKISKVQPQNKQVPLKYRSNLITDARLSRLPIRDAQRASIHGTPEGSHSPVASSAKKASVYSKSSINKTIKLNRASVSKSPSPQHEKKDSSNLEETKTATAVAKPCLRNLSTEKLKQQFCRDTPISLTGRSPYSTPHSIRSFKPQLEDIKSSYLLLNLEENRDTKKPEGGCEKIAVNKPKPLDENLRRKQMSDVKRKYHSKSFWEETRFEKIEGLNWISWK